MDIRTLHSSGISDIELVVIVAKHIDKLLDEHFMPDSHHRKTRRAMLGVKLNISTLDKGFKSIISKNILYQRNDLVHTPDVDTFPNSQSREKFVALSDQVLSEMRRLALARDSDVETDGMEIRLSAIPSCETLSELQNLSEALIQENVSLQELISEDAEDLLRE